MTDRNQTLLRIGAVCAIVGSGVHIVNASIDGFAFDALAAAWSAAPTSGQAILARATDTLLQAVGGTWAMTISLSTACRSCSSGWPSRSTGAIPLAWAGSAPPTALDH